MSVPIIIVKDLKKKYKNDDNLALKGVNIVINEGEFFGLLGPNAAGKTTLISILCGLLKITEGEVIVSGIDVKRHYKQIREFIGLIPQEIAIYPSMTIQENLNYFGRLYGLSGNILKERVDKCMKLLGLNEHANKLVSLCSGGIKRRANLVAGLLHKPKILFFDEPTSGVDAHSRNIIFEYITSLNKEGTTIIYTTHYISEAENLCTNLVILDDGIIIEQGSPKELVLKHHGCKDLGQVFFKITGKELRD